MTNQNEAQKLRESWENDPRWKGITRPYSPEDVIRLRGSIQIEHTLARVGAERLWKLVNLGSFHDFYYCGLLAICPATLCVIEEA